MLQLGAYEHNSGFPIKLNHTLNLSGTILKINDALNKMYKEQVSSNLLLQRVLSKVEGIEANSLTLSNKSVHFDSDFLNLFPLNSVKDFVQNENKIREDTNFISKLVTAFEVIFNFYLFVYLQYFTKRQ